MGFQTSVVRRHMKMTGKFTEASHLASFSLSNAVHLEPGEALIGWYANPAPWDKCFIVFTDKAIYPIEGGRSTRIDVGKIVGYEFPKSKTDVIGVRVRTEDGFRFVRIAGTTGPDGKYKDAFCLINILLAIVRRNNRESTRE